MSKILYGVGRLILQDFYDDSKVFGYTDLQKLSVESTYSLEPITGGNRMFPMASFPKDKSVKISAENATFNPEFIEYLDGATVSKGSVVLTDIIEVAIPDDGVITLDVAPVNVYVEGFKPATAAEPTKGEFKVTEADKQVKFAVADKGTVVKVVYDYNSGAETVSYAVTEKSISKPFKAIYVMDVYDEDSVLKAKHIVKIFKAQCTSGTKFDCSHQTPVAQTFEAEARDPKRADKQLFVEYYEEI